MACQDVEARGSDGGSSDKKSSDANIAVFYYTYSDIEVVIKSVRLDAKLDERSVEYQDYDGKDNTELSLPS